MIPENTSSERDLHKKERGGGIKNIFSWLTMLALLDHP